MPESLENPSPAPETPAAEQQTAPSEEVRFAAREAGQPFEVAVLALVHDHHDPERAVRTRKALLDRLATDRSRVIGYHLPFPGTGFVERSGAAYRFVPSS